MNPGCLEVICGPMFAGKTELLIARIKDLREDGMTVLVIKPSIDNRYSTTEIVTHRGDSMSARAVVATDAWEIDPVFSHVVVDEAQFLSEKEARHLLQWIVNHGQGLIVGGLDLDSGGEPFGPMALFLSCADLVTKLRGLCKSCGGPSTRSQRLTKTEVRKISTVLVGGADCYEPACNRCFRPNRG